MSQVMSKIKQYRSKHHSKHKSGESTSNYQAQSWTVGDSCPSRSRCITNESVTGTFTLLMPMLFILTILMGSISLNHTNVSAAGGSMTVTISDTTVDLNVSPSTNGTFAKSDATTIGVSTTNATGYTLSLTAQAGSNPTSLINGTDNTKMFPSIQSAITEDQFKALDGGTAYNNMWGYLPSKYCTTNNSNSNNGISNNSLNCSTNTNFLPSPTTNGDILDITSSANPSTINEYELTVGARVDTTATLGAYSNVFIVDVVANMIPYSITYYDNVVGAMPTDLTGETQDATVTISSNVPTRTGYSFIAWCTVAPTLNANGTDTCSGTQVNAGGTLNIDQTGDNNNFQLYAMWSGNYTIDGLTYLQDFASLSADAKDRIKASMVEGTQYQLTDRRDNKTYWIAKMKDDKIWMTQGLDLDLSTGTALTHAYSDIGWTTNNTSASWTPARTTIQFNGASSTTMSGWTNDNDTPYSASPNASSGTSANTENMYVYTSGNSNTDTVYAGLAACKADHTEEECSHYKAGNFYNFAAANATNSVAGTVGHTITDSDNGYVLPDSICPSGWRLPHGITGFATNGQMKESNSEFDNLLYLYGVTPTVGATRGQNVGFTSDGLNKVRTTPLYFVRSGNVDGVTLYNRGTNSYSWSSTISATSTGYTLGFYATSMAPAGNNSRLCGFPVRCLAR